MMNRRYIKKWAIRCWSTTILQYICKAIGPSSASPVPLHRHTYILLPIPRRLIPDVSKIHIKYVLIYSISRSEFEGCNKCSSSIQHYFTTCSCVCINLNVFTRGRYLYNMFLAVTERFGPSREIYKSCSPCEAVGNISHMDTPHRNGNEFPEKGKIWALTTENKFSSIPIPHQKDWGVITSVHLSPWEFKTTLLRLLRKTLGSFWTIEYHPSLHQRLSTYTYTLASSSSIWRHVSSPCPRIRKSRWYPDSQYIPFEIYEGVEIAFPGFYTSVEENITDIASEVGLSHTQGKSEYGRV